MITWLVIFGVMSAVTVAMRAAELHGRGPQ
jgi:hypothetical protein